MGGIKPFKVGIIELQNKWSVDDKDLSCIFNAHGPVMGVRDPGMVTCKLQSITQWVCSNAGIEIKAKNLTDYKKVLLDLRGNISNNTVYANADGHIIYWHGNYIPKEIHL